MTEGLSIDEQVERLVARAEELAASDLQGINEAAEELAALAGDDRRVIERARRMVSIRVARDPNRHNQQVGSLIRRAIELGMWRWTWDATKHIP